MSCNCQFKNGKSRTRSLIKITYSSNHIRMITFLVKFWVKRQFIIICQQHQSRLPFERKLGEKQTNKNQGVYAKPIQAKFNVVFFSRLNLEKKTTLNLA